MAALDSPQVAFPNDPLAAVAVAGVVVELIVKNGDGDLSCLLSPPPPSSQWQRS